jgi:hypothetical protein
VNSIDEAIEVAKQFPNPDVEVEVRQVYEPEEFGNSFTRMLKEQEDRLRAQTAQE